MWRELQEAMVFWRMVLFCSQSSRMKFHLLDVSMGEVTWQEDMQPAGTSQALST